MPCWQQSILKLIVELHVVQQLLVRVLIKNNGGVGLFKISQKERLFHLSWQLSALEGNGTIWSFFCTLQKRLSSPLHIFSLTLPPHMRDSLEYKSMLFCSIKNPSSPFNLARNRIYAGTHLKEELTNLFWKLPAYSLFPQKQSRPEC